MIEEEEEQNWFTRWEEELPRPEELMPLSQSLITPDLALAFDIPSPNPNLGGGHQAHGIAGGQNPPQGLLASADFESADQSSPAGDEPARTLKRPRLVWTPQLHKRFVDAVAHLGIKNAVPKTIMQLMSVDGLTRENVASHLQKYRLYLKRMQGLSSSAAGPPCQMSAVDAATEQLFAGSPIPHPFLAGRTAPAGAGQEPFMQFMSPPLLQHHQQMAAAAAAAAAAQHQFYHQRQMGHFTYDNGFHSRGVVQPGGHRMGVSGLGIAQASPSVLHHPNSYGEDADSASGGGRRVLTLFPTNTDD